MNRLDDQKGEINLLIIPLALASLLLVVALIFGYVTYKKEQNYKNNVDQIAAAKVKDAVTDQKAIDKADYIERSKQPLVTYRGPAGLGSLVMPYPKTWSVYVERRSSSTPIDGFGYPGQVPGDNNNHTAYALRFQVVDDDYSQVVDRFGSALQQQKVSIKPYRSKQVPNIIGVKVVGEIDHEKHGIMVILPLRDKTLKVWTEAQQFEDDFNTYILPNYSFSP